MRILITGATGMLGVELLRVLAQHHRCTGGSSVRPLGTDRWFEADLAAPAQWQAKLHALAPEVIVHAAALTHVDSCERDPDLARRINSDATRILAKYCADNGAYFAYISTDAVFDGQKLGRYTEADATGPVNVYGRSKLDGEAAALACPGALVLRTNIFGWRPGRADSFAEWVLEALRAQSPLTMFTDVSYTPVATSLLARMVEKCVEARLPGLHHAGGAQSLSKYDFALRVAAAYGLSTDCIEPISVDDKPLAARRPRNMALDSSRLARALGIALPDVDASIEAWKNTQPAGAKA